MVGQPHLVAKLSPNGCEQSKKCVEHELVFAWFERLRVERDRGVANAANRDAWLAVPQRGDQCRGRPLERRLEIKNGSAVGLARQRWTEAS